MLVKGVKILAKRSRRTEITMNEANKKKRMRMVIRKIVVKMRELFSGIKGENNMDLNNE